MSISSLRSIIRDLIREVDDDTESTLSEFCAVGAGGAALSAPTGGPQIVGHMSAPWSPVKTKKRRRLKRKLN